MSIEVSTPKCEVVNMSNFNAMTLSEYVGRVCYQTQDKITNDSYVKFLCHSGKNGHRSLFEFSNLEVKIYFDKEIQNENLSFFDTCNFIICKKYDKFNLYYGSFRAFIEIIEDYVKGYIKCNYNIICELFYDLIEMFGDVIENWNTYNTLVLFFNLRHNGYNRIFIKDITPLNVYVDDYDKVLVRVTTSRGVHNEFVRHRMTHWKGGVSYMAESQRYVRYGVKRPFTIIIPSTHIDNEEYLSLTKTSAELAFKAYKGLLNIGYSPSLASATLPRCTAIEYFIYTTIDEWRHIFRLRTSKYAHIEFQEVAKNIRDEMINKGICI